MKITLPEEVSYIIRKLNDNGHQAYVVGGCVRDSFLGRIPDDWDITTSALPQEVKKVFSKTIDTGIQHGTVTVRQNHKSFEVTTYRVDGEYLDGRHPKQVSFTRSLEEDLKRRDFTINAMAYNDDEGLVDIFGGIDDLDKKVIRAVGNATERFSEDALRMLRALRFSAQLDFEIEKDTFLAIKDLASTITKISAERIQVELIKLITSNHPEKMIDVYNSGLTQFILPEFDEMMECEQNTPHHMYTVGLHTIKAMQGVPNDKVLRLTMLMHDMGKPACKVTDENGRDHFHGHPAVSEKISREIFSRLKFDNATRDIVCALVANHDVRPELRKKPIRRLIAKTGTQIFPALFTVNRADILAQSMYKRDEKLERVDQFEEIYNEIISQNECIKISDLAIRGADLIEAGVDKGPVIGVILNKLFDLVVDDPSLNNSQTLMQLAMDIVKTV